MDEETDLECIMKNFDIFMESISSDYKDDEEVQEFLSLSMRYYVTHGYSDCKVVFY
jgi:hypothetical protein